MSTRKDDEVFDVVPGGASPACPGEVLNRLRGGRTPQWIATVTARSMSTAP